MSQDIKLTAVTEHESMEFFCEGLKQAASAARQLSRLQEHPIWYDISVIMDQLHNSGVQLASAKPLSRQTTLSMLDRREKKMAENLDKKRPYKLIVN